MTKNILPAAALVLGLILIASPLCAMPGDDWAKEDLGFMYPPPLEEEAGEFQGKLVNGCWEARNPYGEFNPLWIPSSRPENPYEILPGVLDTEQGDKLAKLCNCQAMVSCDALLAARLEVRPQNKRQMAITEVIDVTPDVPFNLVP